MQASQGKFEVIFFFISLVLVLVFAVFYLVSFPYGTGSDSDAAATKDKAAVLQQLKDNGPQPPSLGQRVDTIQSMSEESGSLHDYSEAGKLQILNQLKGTATE